MQARTNVATMQGQVQEVRHNVATFVISTIARNDIPHTPGITAMYASSHAAALLDQLRIPREDFMNLFEAAVRYVTAPPAPNARLKVVAAHRMGPPHGLILCGARRTFRN